MNHEPDALARAATYLREVTEALVDLDAATAGEVLKGMAEATAQAKRMRRRQIPMSTIVLAQEQTSEMLRHHGNLRWLGWSLLACNLTAAGSADRSRGEPLERAVQAVVAAVIQASDDVGGVVVPSGEGESPPQDQAATEPTQTSG